ncbi:MAG: TfoX/Sxy family protein [Nocardioides sp.]
MATHSPEDKERFRSLVDPHPGVEIKRLFGSVGAWIDGTMFAALFSPHIGVKLSPADAAELAALDGVGPFGPPQKPMSGYLTLPLGMDDATAREWVVRAREYVATLPPKVRR